MSNEAGPDGATTQQDDADTSDGLHRSRSVIDERMTDFTLIIKSFENSAEAKPVPWREHPKIKPKPNVPKKSDKQLWIAEMKRKGVNYATNLENEMLFPHVDCYALFFHDKCREASSERWLKNLLHLFQLISEKESGNDSSTSSLSTVFYLVELETPATMDMKAMENDVAIKRFVKGKVVSKDVLAEDMGKPEDGDTNKGIQPRRLKDIVPNSDLLHLATCGAIFKHIEVGIGMPLSVFKAKKCLVLEVELPNSALTPQQKRTFQQRVSFFSNLIETYNHPGTPQLGVEDEYDFYVIQRYETTGKENFEILIRQYQNGTLINEDLYHDYEKFQGLCLVKTTKTSEKFNLPRKKAFLEITCPCYASPNPKENLKVFRGSTMTKRWSCADCLEDFIYGFDGLLYCFCGTSSVQEKLTFRCNEDNHGPKFKPLLGKDVKLYLSELKEMEEMNLLFLGETGVGKSTFINAFANYFSYSSLEEASDGDLMSLIPTSFSIIDHTMQPKVVTFGEDSNECCEVGKSATQSCKSYVIKNDDTLLQLIDTPGIGDVRGIDYDSKNFENILSFVSNYQQIHAVCVLIKPNHSRLSTVFQFCIKSLLCQLHKSASENIVFIFTNTRGTFYYPGDTLPVLRELLIGIRDSEPFVDIPLTLDNMYCFDNEAFRYLVAIRNGIVFSDDHRKDFHISWEKSSMESKRLLNYVTRLKPHSVKDMMSLSQARFMIISLSKPLADISQNIQQNIILLEEQEANLHRAMHDMSLLHDKLYVPTLDFNIIKYDQPRTVCTSEKCVKVVNVDGIAVMDYAKICHNPCYLKNISAEVVNCSELLYCWAMNKTEKCRVCQCSWRAHMHIYYELEKRTVNKMDTKVQYDMNNKESTFRAAQKVIEECEKRRMELEVEQEAITKACAMFAHFLKKNAIAPYNDTIEEYINYLIEVEKMKSSQVDDKRRNIDHFESLKREYLAQIQILEDSIQQGSESFSTTKLEPQDIARTVQSLYNLKLYGSNIRKIEATMKAAKANEHHVTAFDRTKQATISFKKKKKTIFKKLKRQFSTKDNKNVNTVFFG